MPIDGIGLALQELAEHLDRPELIKRKIAQPTHVAGVVRLVSGECIRESGPHARPRWWVRGHGAKAEVGWIMVQEGAQPTRAIGPHSTSGNDAGQGDRLAVLLLHGEQARPVSLRILAGQIADLEALDPHGYGGGVIGVLRLGR